MRRRLPLALLLLWPAAARPDLGPLFLASLSVEAPAGLDLQAGPLQVTLDLHPGAAHKAASLREWFPGLATDGDRVTLVVDGYPAATSPAAPRHLAPSFVVDFDQPAFAPLRAELARLDGPDPEGAALARLADRWIVRKSMRRAFDAASTVAENREGDCTEHAVLLAALVRMQGRPSRVVVGVALLAADAGPLAVGHAWAELHDGKRWLPADATGLPPDRVRYLPTAVLGNEGPGHLMSLVGQISPLDVRRVVLAPAKGERARGDAHAPPAARPSPAGIDAARP